MIIGGVALKIKAVADGPLLLPLTSLPLSPSLALNDANEDLNEDLREVAVIAYISVVVASLLIPILAG